MTEQNVPQEEPSSFTEDMFGTAVYETEKPIKRFFLPWHRPRKQFVREKLWCKEINLLLDTHIASDREFLTYFGLPGDDLLDIRYFHDKICVPRGIKLKFLGFNKVSRRDLHPAEYEISLDEVNKLPNIHVGSQILPDDITDIVHDSSIAWRQSRRMGPFDVINLDLCDGFAKHPVGDFKGTHFNSISKLLAFQARRTDPWLLLITTRTNKNCINQEVFELLKEIYSQNLKDCTEFLEESRSLFSVDSDETLESYCESSKGTAEVFLISLCKWIAGIVLQQNPQSNLELKGICGYRVFARAEWLDMTSVVIKISPKIESGTDKWSLAGASKPPITECNVSPGIIRKAAGQKDVDKILQENKILFEEMTESMAGLLEKARYDLTEYRVWVNSP